MKNGIIASGAILQYLTMTQHTQIGHITSLARIEEDKYVRLDKFTVRSLELIGNMNDGGSSLINVIDRTISPMGARLLKRWMVFPLKDEKPINERLNVVEYFFRQPDFKELIEEQLHLIGDLERIISKVAVGRVSPREVVQLKVALQAIEPIKQACMEADNASLNRIGEQLNLCISIRDRIAKEIKNDPPLLINKGGVIQDGVNADLDELRQISYSGKDYLLKIQQRESEETGIPSLKVAYNNVFGYYIEVRNVHKDKVPPEWIRKQTLVNAERYITQELKEYEEKILGAEDKILVLETQLYTDLVQALMEFIPQIQINANQIARLDCLLSFANVARENRYIRPIIEDNDVLDIRQGRHPVIEKQLPIGEKYIANDVMLDSNTQQIIIITGPNMAGKSALLRQTALITLLAQIGSFVPAESAHIGLVDKIFTRVGASDNISVGESTFMVEMNEAADILNNVSSRSLVLFDELGRGTSTYDGISIAWAIVEYIHEHPKAKARTLFATHYHELNEMEKSFKRIKNYNVSVKEVDNKVIFLRKLERGGSEHSFGIHVAKMASMNNNARKYNRYNEVDERILALFAENKEKAFRLLYDTYYLPLCLYSVQFTGSTETSEDIVQNLFVSFWDKNSHTTISSNLHAWLFNAVRFSSLTKVQRERYFSLDEMEEESYSPIDDFYDEEELLQKRNQLLTELKKLPEQEYNVLVKIVLEDKKYKEVAEELHISVNTVKTHLSRALKMLRRFNMIEILILFNL